jgi:cobalt-zinc-cadmium efflux system protein
MGHHHHDHGHAHHEHHAASYTRRFGLTIFFNLIITGVEFVGGILSGSLALLSDAAHNLSDVLALIFGYLGEKVSERKPDLEYSFGLKRFEVITAVVNALALCGVGVFIVYEAFVRWRNPVEVNLSLMLPIALVGLAGNVLSILVLGRGDKRLNVRAAFIHLLYDAVSSVAVIITGIVMFYTRAFWLDPLISIFIVIMIGVSSFDILLDAMRIILQIAPKHIDTQSVYRHIMDTSGGANVHGLHIWSVSSSEIFLSCHICMNRNAEEVDADKIITAVNAMLAEEFHITHTTIQVEAGTFCLAGEKGCCNKGA